MSTKHVRIIIVMMLVLTNMLGMFFVGIDMIVTGNSEHWPLFFGHFFAATVCWLWLNRMW